MKLQVDKGGDALYLRLDKSAIVETEEVAPVSRLTTTSRVRWSAWRCSTCRVGRPR